MQVQAGPSRATALLLLAGAVVLVAVGLLTDVGGALLALPGAAVSLALGLRDLLLVPTLEADGEGLLLVQGLSRRALRWEQVQRLRVVQDRRAVLLEVDLGEEVLLLSRSRLGRDPRDVLDALQALRPAT